MLLARITILIKGDENAFTDKFVTRVEDIDFQSLIKNKLEDCEGCESIEVTVIES